MNPPPTLLQLSRLFSRMAPVAAVLFLLLLADIFISSYRESKMPYRALPGGSQAVSGDLAYPASAMAKISYTASSPHIRLEITATQGKLWRGRLHVDAGTPPGEYAWQVFSGRTPPPQAPPPYRILVFTDAAQLNASSPSLCRRYLGIAPIWPALAMFVVVIAGLAGSFLLSTHREDQLASQDIVPIAKMARTKQGWEIHFALGLRHGLRQHDTLLLLDAGFEPAGRITVERVEADHSCALVPFDRNIAPDYWLAKAQE
jgi:hypothetical protein